MRSSPALLIKSPVLSSVESRQPTALHRPDWAVSVQAWYAARSDSNCAHTSVTEESEPELSVDEPAGITMAFEVVHSRARAVNGSERMTLAENRVLRIVGVVLLE